LAADWVHPGFSAAQPSNLALAQATSNPARRSQLSDLTVITNLLDLARGGASPTPKTLGGTTDRDRLAWKAR